ncbi:hypothetical protein N7462_008995 [Penicillium macrosclerotiorum]|uniref:uncharacterized protein n=1 Tax=Penicillium macrosclerotiorum TaxID=303699 RepID=UPI002546799F|nr:uncharacterized protein N7462_008995 [Penicillium macrosclerotiorum]KAJ5676098.1 hypothetical protein N7462_008995 [Penicillium macrosclerotiorum]
MSNSNYITKVALVGATGNSGSFMAEALLKTGKHTVTVLTRASSKSKLPEGAIPKIIDYEKLDTLVEALKGQEALVITMKSQVKEAESKLITAAAEAGVKWIMPNEWCPDSTNEGLRNDVFIYPPREASRKLVRDLGISNYICLSTGFWYEWSLAIAPAFGIDLLHHAATLFDEGETKITVSTWPQVGRAVAGILSLPIKPEGSNPEACLENLANRVVYIKSFTVSQKEMLESAFRVTNTKESDWTISKESSHQRYSNGMKEMKEGHLEGFIKMLYTRVFYPDGTGDIENKGTINDLLELPEEDMDEATKAAIQRAKSTTSQ